MVERYEVFNGNLDTILEERSMAVSDCEIQRQMNEEEVLVVFREEQRAPLESELRATQGRKIIVMVVVLLLLLGACGFAVYFSLVHRQNKGDSKRLQEANEKQHYPNETQTLSLTIEISARAHYIHSNGTPKSVTVNSIFNVPTNNATPFHIEPSQSLSRVLSVLPSIKTYKKYSTATDTSFIVRAISSLKIPELGYSSTNVWKPSMTQKEATINGSATMKERLSSSQSHSSKMNNQTINVTKGSFSFLSTMSVILTSSVTEFNRRIKNPSEDTQRVSALKPTTQNVKESFTILQSKVSSVTSTPLLALSSKLPLPSHTIVASATFHSHFGSVSTYLQNKFTTLEPLPSSPNSARELSLFSRLTLPILVSSSLSSDWNDEYKVSAPASFQQNLSHFAGSIKTKPSFTKLLQSKVQKAETTTKPPRRPFARVSSTSKTHAVSESAYHPTILLSRLNSSLLDYPQRSEAANGSHNIKTLSPSILKSTNPPYFKKFSSTTCKVSTINSSTVLFASEKEEKFLTSVSIQTVLKSSYFSEKPFKTARSDQGSTVVQDIAKPSLYVSKINTSSVLTFFARSSLNSVYGKPRQISTEHVISQTNNRESGNQNLVSHLPVSISDSFHRDIQLTSDVSTMKFEATRLTKVSALKITASEVIENNIIPTELKTIFEEKLATTKNLSIVNKISNGIKISKTVKKSHTERLPNTNTALSNIFLEQLPSQTTRYEKAKLFSTIPMINSTATTEETRTGMAAKTTTLTSTKSAKLQMAVTQAGQSRSSDPSIKSVETSFLADEKSLQVKPSPLVAKLSSKKVLFKMPTNQSRQGNTITNQPSNLKGYSTITEAISQGGYITTTNPLRGYNATSTPSRQRGYISSTKSSIQVDYINTTRSSNHGNYVTSTRPSSLESFISTAESVIGRDYVSTSARLRNTYPSSPSSLLHQDPTIVSTSQHHGYAHQTFAKVTTFENSTSILASSTVYHSNFFTKTLVTTFPLIISHFVSSTPKSMSDTNKTMEYFVGSLRILNILYHKNLSDPNTTMSRNLTNMVEDLLKIIYTRSQVQLEKIQVTEFQNGSVIAFFFMTFNSQYNYSASFLRNVLISANVSFWSGYKVCNISLHKWIPTSTLPTVTKNNQDRKSRVAVPLSIAMVTLVLLFSFLGYRHCKMKDWYRGRRVKPVRDEEENENRVELQMEMKKVDSSQVQSLSRRAEHSSIKTADNW